MTTPERLLEALYDELRGVAVALLRDQRPGHTLQPTALVHEAYLKLDRLENVTWESRGQFYAIASRAMRTILVDHARGKRRLKRGGPERGERLTMAGVEDGSRPFAAIDLLALDEALTTLATLSERQAQLVELRFFGGVTADEAADALGIARSTAADDWRLARAWLKKALREDGAGS